MLSPQLRWQMKGMNFRLPHAIILFCLVISSIYLLVVRRHRHAPSLVHTSFYHKPSAGTLRAWVEREEEMYSRTVAARAAFVREWGGDLAQIESFPSHTKRYTLWDFFPPTFNCPHRVDRIGVVGDGGKWVCGMEVVAMKQECVIYSVGINGESSFEADLLDRAPGCQVWGYDYSVDSFGPEIQRFEDLKNRSHFEPWALGGKDAHGVNDKPKYYTLQTIMELNGHDFIDILKIDIESGEFDALIPLLETYVHSPSGPARPLPIGQLQLEIHAWNGRDRLNSFLPWFELMERAGLRPFRNEPNLVYLGWVKGSHPDLVEYSFINIGGDHELISGNAVPW